MAILINKGNTLRGTLLPSPATSHPISPLKQNSVNLHFPFQATPGRIHQLAPPMSDVGVPLVSSIQRCLIQKQPYKQDQHLGIKPGVQKSGDGFHKLSWFTCHDSVLKRNSWSCTKSSQQYLHDPKKALGIKDIMQSFQIPIQHPCLTAIQ